MKENLIRLKNRDLSWLAFNHRVLQEASDPSVPLYERVKFLAIWSSNLDEFFRVRVASLRTLQRLKKKTQKQFELEPTKLLKRLLKAVTLQQEEFGDIFRNQIKKELHRQGILLVRETELNESQREFARSFFRDKVRPFLSPVILDATDPPFLENKAIYLAVRLLDPLAAEKKRAEHIGLVKIPATVSRFVSFPPTAAHHHFMFVDDLMRLCLAEIFPNRLVAEAHAIKLTRDAELDIDDELSGDLLEKVKKALRKRDEGVPSRFLYDSEMPKKMLALMKDMLCLHDDDIVVGSRYHNFSDFFAFPNPKDPALTYEPMPPFALKKCDATTPLFVQLRDKEILSHYPYHSYECVIRFLREAADDPSVTSIKITLYRVAKNSQVAQELIRAARNGKVVTAFVEVKARFDEESNIRWAAEMENAGVRVLYSIPNLKVHAKLCLVSRTRDATAVHPVDERKEELFAYMSTGNFNEMAAKLYTDFGFFTADERLTREVQKVFEVLCRERENARFKHLLVPPFSMRQTFVKLIEREMKNAKKGKDAFIIAKMNSLEDPKMIAKLYEASEAGVRIQLIIRGICCLIPGIKGMSENIDVISIVDRFLEHARVFVFCNGGNELYYLSSADWMKRNLDRRIEVAFPIYDRGIRKQIRAILELQLNDTVKARVINKKLENKTPSVKSASKLRSQYATWEFWRDA